MFNTEDEILRRLQEKNLEMAVMFYHWCQRNHLTCYLCGGGCIGCGGWYYGGARGNTGGCGWPGGEGVLPFQPRKTALVRAPVIFAVAAGYQVIDIRTEFGDFAFGYRIVGYIDDIGCDFL